MKPAFVAGSKVATEEYCNFGVNAGKVWLLMGGALRVAGSDEEVT